MRQLITIIAVLIVSACLAQKTDTLKRASRKVDFIARIDIQSLTKEGIYANGYIVHIESEEARLLNGKKVRIRGRARVVTGINPLDTEVRQGRQGDTKHILNPKIEIVN